VKIASGVEIGTEYEREIFDLDVPLTVRQSHNKRLAFGVAALYVADVVA